MALWGGCMLEAAGKRVYFAGDTGYGTGNIFRDIGARFGAVDLAILPIGAYDPRWFMAAQHCDPEEAIRIMLDVGAKSALGMHWGRSEEHTSELQSLMRISYAVFCLKQKNKGIVTSICMFLVIR